MRTGAVLLTAILLAGCDTASEPSPVPGTDSALRVTELAGGLEHGWDIGFLPSGAQLITERPGKLVTVTDGQVRPVRAELGDVYAVGEGGLLGLALDPGFGRNRTFYTCQAHAEGGSPVDVRLVRWRLSPDERSAQRLGDLLTGLPLNPGGRHSGCRPTFAPDGMLLVGTGDAARADAAQDRRGLGGKVLRIDPRTGKAPADNPFPGSPVLSYGHRNVQGVAVRPGTGQVYLAEHGPSFDDEINRNVPGGNFGWDPAKDGTEGGYDESVPMTDTARFPDAVRPLWTSGRITEAISGATFLSGPSWGELNGALAVVALKGQKLLLYQLSGEGAVVRVRLPGVLNESYGRLRAARTGPDGALYVTTSNGADDKLLRLSPV
ncbi:PQQ-dependent sugar dehydrogenase [Sciscionella marina]|uniref:PQQ-dependent sugar dehydrogenase n=1 Tax=Sciscionella marina TaxID=508770 RepID=UPI000373ABA4|nr:PQQ-dependent sugar dehydrogenase [Sciscionella marina]